MFTKILTVLEGLFNLFREFHNFGKKAQIERKNAAIKTEVSNKDVDKINDRWTDAL